MSRSGKAPIKLPTGVEIKVEKEKISVKGPKDAQECILPKGIEVEVKEGELFVTAQGDSRDSRRLHGLSRALINNMVVGTSQGFEKKLELRGVGYRAAVKGDKLDLELGFSHPTLLDIPQGIQVKVSENTKVTVSGSSVQEVGQFAAEIRALRKPEPYKGKGIRYVDEYVRHKAGKAGK